MSVNITQIQWKIVQIGFNIDRVRLLAEGEGFRTRIKEKGEVVGEGEKPLPLSW